MRRQATPDRGGIGRRRPDVAISLRIGVRSGFEATDLLRRNADHWMTPFQIPVWRSAWQHRFGAIENTQPVTAILKRAGRTVAILPLAVHETHKLRILTWHAGEQSDYGAPIVRQGQIEAFSTLSGSTVLRDIAADIGGIDLVYLPKQPLSIGGATNPLVLPGSVSHHAGAHAISFVPGESWDQFLIRKRSASTRQQLRKKARVLEKAGEVAFHVAATPEEARPLVIHCLAAKSKQLAQLGHHDPFASPDVRSFLHEFFAAGAGNETWAVSLTLDGGLLATAVGFARPNGWLLYQMAMDGDHVAHASPGTQLLMRIMQHCIANNIPRLDLALGDESYKLEWCDEHQALVSSVLPLTVRGHVAAAGLSFKARLQKKIAGNPRLYDLGKTLKRRLQQLNIPV